MKKLLLIAAMLLTTGLYAEDNAYSITSASKLYCYFDEVQFGNDEWKELGDKQSIYGNYDVKNNGDIIVVKDKEYKYTVTAKNGMMVFEFKKDKLGIWDGQSAKSVSGNSHYYYKAMFVMEEEDISLSGSCRVATK